MKRTFSILLIITVYISVASPVRAQSQELQQLILNLEKLNQLRAILDQMYKGFQIVSKGYNMIKDLSEGNFNLHKVFLDKLLQVSPLVKKYKRVAEIISLQQSLVKEYKAAFFKFKTLKLFNQNDLRYFERVYDNLFDKSLKNLEELLMVVTANQLRMNDAERINAIDQIYVSIQDKLTFLRHFNKNISLLALQRQQELNDTKSIEKIYGIVD